MISTSVKSRWPSRGNRTGVVQTKAHMCTWTDGLQINLVLILQETYILNLKKNTPPLDNQPLLSAKTNQLHDLWLRPVLLLLLSLSFTTIIKISLSILLNIACTHNANATDKHLCVVLREYVMFTNCWTGCAITFSVKQNVEDCDCWCSKGTKTHVIVSR